jgi:hypothetical protein
MKHHAWCATSSRAASTSELDREEDATRVFPWWRASVYAPLISLLIFIEHVNVLSHHPNSTSIKML